MNGLLLLFIEFFKIGLFSVGGGMATLPFLYRLADKYTWFSVNQIPDMIAISESTPGPLGVNMATYTGFQFGGALGSVCATLGLIFPSVVIIVIISKFLEKFRNNKYVEYAFYGLRPAAYSRSRRADWCAVPFGNIGRAGIFHAGQHDRDKRMYPVCCSAVCDK